MESILFPCLTFDLKEKDLHGLANRVPTSSGGRKEPDGVRITPTRP
jgi:hypothetical protein